MIILFQLLMISLVFAEKLQTKTKTQKFVIHMQEEKQFLNQNLSHAVDVMLIHHGNQDQHHAQHICTVEQRGVDLDTQEIQLISNLDINSELFDPNTKLDLKSFLSMAHVQDGILAVDSSMEIFLLKFNYQELHQMDNYDSLNELAEQPNFASITWKASLKETLWSKKSKTELPQLVYALNQNVAYLVYTDTVLIFSVDQMEKNSALLEVQASDNWKKRKERGWSKTFGNYFYSAVGQLSMDIYFIDKLELIFVQNMNIQLQDKQALPLVYRDFEILQCIPTGMHIDCHQLILLEQNHGILVVQVNVESERNLNYEVKMINIGPQRGGIALDTLDGQTVIAAYHIGDRYVAQEILINHDKLDFEVVASYEQRTKLVDIKMNEDIAVLQGVSHHQIIFHGTPSGLRTYSLNEQINVKQGAMRDFDFFNPKQMEQPDNYDILKTLNGGFKFDDFMFGVTKHKMFVTRYRVTSPHIICFTDDESLSKQTFLYTAVYNITDCTDTLNSGLCKKELNFSIEVVSTIMYEGKVQILIVASIFLGLIFVALVLLIIILYRRYKHDSNYLQNQVSQIQAKNPHANLDESSNKLDLSSVKRGLESKRTL